MTKTELMARAKVMEALGAIVGEFHRQGSSRDGLRLVELYCDDELRQRYGDEFILGVAEMQFDGASQELSEKATQWFKEFNEEYFGGKLEPWRVKVSYEENGDRLTSADPFTIYFYGVDHDIPDLLLFEMASIATFRERHTILERELSRLEDAGAPVIHLARLFSSENEPVMPMSQNGNDTVGT